MTSDISKQRTAPSTKKFEFAWRRPVPDALQQGAHFMKYDEDTGCIERNTLVKVDSYGFFLYWKSQSGEGQVVDLSQVSDVRRCQKNKLEKIGSLLPENMCSPLEDCVITVCSGVDLVNVTYTHFITVVPATADYWIRNLHKLIRNTKQYNMSPLQQLQKHWMRLCFSVNANGKIPVRVISKTFASGRTEKVIFQSLKDLKLPFGKNDEIDPSLFTYKIFYSLYHKICPRTDIEPLFQKLSGTEDGISEEKFLEFLNTSQRDSRLNEALYPFATTSAFINVLRCYELNPEKRLLSREGFYRYLMSDDNAPVVLSYLDVYQSMQEPISHYYINSSHNTYLTGRQFGGKSSVEMYRQVLLSGCRSVELDCWDGKGDDQEPIVTHGKARCTTILFKDAITAIRDTAFTTSEFPVILSFENHCCKLQQYKVAKYCEEIFGDMLLSKPLDKYPLEAGIELPSPNDLKRKILIKNKRLKPEIEKAQMERLAKGIMDEMIEDSSVTIEEEISVAESSNGLNDNDFISPLPETSGSGEAAVIPKDTTDNLTAEQEQAMLERYHYTGATTNIHPYLSSLVNYVQPVKFPGFRVSEEEDLRFHMSSFSETVALGHLKNQSIEFVNYGKKQLSRIYPRGNRVDSSNYLPQIFWNAGCQLVSLNFQTPDVPMQLNQGKFEFNGNCGYLLKPEFMRRPEKNFDPFSESALDGVIAATCEVHIISGQFLSDKKVGTYVEVDMYGLPTDTIRKEFRTRVIPGNGLNPIYGDDAVFVFRKIVLPDLATLRFAVYDDTGKMLGQRVIPLECLQNGYRHITLRTGGNFPLSLPTLFCHINLATYVPEGMMDLVDALIDPKAFVSREERRLKQLICLGVDPKELEEVSPFVGLVEKGASSGTSGEFASSGTKEEEFKLETIRLRDLMQEKTYEKCTKIHQKERQTMQRNHEREHLSVLKAQTIATDHLISNQLKELTHAKSQPTTSAATSLKAVELNQSRRISALVEEHSDDWIAVRKRHITEEYELAMYGLSSKYGVLSRLITEAFERQKKRLLNIHSRERKEMKKQQAKISIENNYNVMHDKKLGNRAERDRKKRELVDVNTKRFIEQRKLQAQKHDQKVSELSRKQEELERTFQNEIAKEKDECTVKYREELLAVRRSAVV